MVIGVRCFPGQGGAGYETVTVHDLLRRALLRGTLFAPNKVTVKRPCPAELDAAPGKSILVSIPLKYSETVSCLIAKFN